MNNEVEAGKQPEEKPAIRRIGWDVFINLVVAAITAAAIAAWPTIQAFTFPDFISGEYILLGPEEKPGRGPDVIYVNLKSYNGHVWGAMHQDSKRWSITGYWKNNHLVFAYRSDGNGLDSIGFGEQFFTPIQAGSKSVLMGDTRGNYCFDEPETRPPEILRCPNVLVQGGAESASSASRQYAAYLGTIKQCVPVDIPVNSNVAKSELKCP